MYCIINIHYDSGWVNQFPEDVEGCMYRYTHMWEQICKGFENYDEHLIFESQNEELGWDSMWNEWGEPKDKEGSYTLVNKVNQQFVNTVRASGGNNPERHLLISGYKTDITKTCDPLFKMPEDPKNRCAVSVHYYTPVGFAILEEDTDWAKNRTTWGTDDDFKELNNYMNMMKTTFIDNNIPVIVGEYGCPVKNKEADSVNLFLRSVCSTAYEAGLCPIMWDTTDQQYDRTACQLKDRNLAEFFKQFAKSEPETVKGDVNSDGELSLVDLIALQKWIMKTGTSLNNWEAADFDGNGMLNVVDLGLMKRELLQK